MTACCQCTVPLLLAHQINTASDSIGDKGCEITLFKQETDIAKLHYDEKPILNTEYSNKVILDQVQNRLKNHRPRTISAQLPEAAVLIPLTDASEPELIFTRRAAHMNTHSGEVAFPGGKRDCADQSLVHTALRESYEEMALPPEKVTVIGQGGAVVSRFGLKVTPVVGIIAADTPLTANTAELDRIFSVPLSYFLDGKNLTFSSTGNEPIELPSFRYNEYLIWGLTAIILIEFLNTTVDAGIALPAEFIASHYGPGRH